MFLTVTPNPCIDKTIFIPEYKPGDRIRSKRYSIVAGGKGNNVARVIRFLGYNAYALLWVGGYTGKEVIRILREEDKVKPIPVWTQMPTRTITTIYEEFVERQTAFFEPGPNISITEYRNMTEKFKRTLTNMRIKVATFSGTIPDKSAVNLYKSLIKIAHNYNVLTILDSYGEEFREGLKSKPDVVKPNLKEAEEFFNCKLESRPEQIEALETLIKKYKIKVASISLGHDGCLITDGNTYLHAIPPKIKEINSVGSGDALVAGFAICFAKKYSISTAAKLGVALGTANAMQWEIGKFSMRDLIEVYQQVKIYKINRLNCNQQVLLEEHIPLDTLIPKIKHFSQ